MSTALDRPYQPAHQAIQHGSNFSGTFAMLRLCLRRDRVVLPLWVLLLSVPLATVYVGSIEKVGSPDVHVDRGACGMGGDGAAGAHGR
jgi:ABC-2 type transport system permease protein